MSDASFLIQQGVLFLMRRNLLLILCFISPETLVADENCASAYSDPVSILTEAWELPSQGGGFFLDEFQVRDFDGDGDLDVFSVEIDETYNGSPNYTLKYYEGENDQYCRILNSPSMPSIDRNVSLKIIARKQVKPSFVFEYTLADPVKLTTKKVNSTFEFDETSHSYTDITR